MEPKSGTYLKVRAHPDSGENRLESRSADSFEVWVKAPAERGLANAAVLALVASSVGVPAKRLRLIKGAQSPSKIIQII